MNRPISQIIPWAAAVPAMIFRALAESVERGTETLMPPRISPSLYPWFA